jgi:D-beta-D-heptose 7-phosphate kinase/D-beta-D-heptose 1-phosphate adenosyltransferase
MRSFKEKSTHSKLKSLRSLLAALKKEKRSNKKIVFTNGCFDILHVGHIRYLKQAKSLGDRLVIGLNADASVRKLKGPSRPLNSEKDRAEVLSALECVDHIVFFREDTPETLIRAVRPHFLVKGGDWKKKDIVGSEFVESYGGKVLSLQFVKGFSTTGLLEKIQKL